MIDHDSKLSISRQADLLNMSRRRINYAGIKPINSKIKAISAMTMNASRFGALLRRFGGELRFLFMDHYRKT